MRLLIISLSISDIITLATGMQWIFTSSGEHWGKTVVRLEKVLAEYPFLTYFDLSGGGSLLNNFLGRPCRLQKKTESCCGEPGILCRVGGDPSKDLLAVGGDPSRDLLGPGVFGSTDAGVPEGGRAGGGGGGGGK